MEDEQVISKRERKKLNRENKVSENKPPIGNKLLVVGVIVILALAAFWFLYKGGDSTTPTNEVLSIDEVSENDHTRGAEDASIVIIEYADFQCPACAAYNPIMSQIYDEFGDRIQIVHRHFPLHSIHRHAQIAAQASEAANMQGKFWEYADLLYQNQAEWVNVRDPRSNFLEYARQLELNEEEFNDYMNSNEAKDKVDSHYQSAVASGLTSTPSFFINGEKIDNPQGIEPFRQLIFDHLGDGAEGETEDENEEATGSGETEAPQATEEAEINPTL